MIVNRTKRVLNSVSEIKVFFSSKAKPTNHYETLKVSQNSTQDDIKSAYYELSKKYHPDVNKSDDAKKNFQKVSDAYEVLGNFNKRKLYDRDLLATGVGTRKTQTYTHPEDPLAGFYRSRQQSQREYDPMREKATNQANFDFDKWTRAHYGNTLRRSLRDKSNRILREQLKKQYQEEMEKQKSGAIFIIVTSIIVLFMLALQSYQTKHAYDKNLINNRK